MNLKTKILLLTSSLLLSFTACSTPTQTILAQIAIQRAVYEVVKDKPDRADRVVVIAAEVESLASGDTASTVDLLVSLVRAKIDWSKLSPPDQQFVNTLLDLAVVELKEQVGSGDISGEKWATVKTLATWIRESAELYDSKP